jgi:hypothetical protein
MSSDTRNSDMKGPTEFVRRRDIICSPFVVAIAMGVIVFALELLFYGY